jgi:cytochrome c2
VIRRSLPLAIAAAFLHFGCNASLPEPESAGARLFAERCNGCHRIYAPQALTFPMWEIMVDRMQGEMVRRGAAPLSADERAVLMPYLKKHAQAPPP